MSVRKRRCARCKRVKPWSAYESTRSRRCLECIEAMRQPCANCGRPVPVPKWHKPRKVCDRPECLSWKQAEAQRIRHARTRARNAASPTQRCPVCLKRKRKNARNFYPGRRDPDTGAIVQWDTYCKPCRRADSVARYKGDERRREKCRQRSKRAYEQLKAKRAADPEFDREWHEHRNAVQQAWKQRRKKEAGLPEPQRTAGGPEIPTAALVAKIHELIADGEVIYGTNGATAGIVCERLGIDPRQLYAWESGEIERVRFDVADRVLVGMGLDPLDVWDAAELPEWLHRDG